ncbi:hypothetical protein BDV12DRAFT_190426 [Aspergillus spectabilis]
MLLRQNRSCTTVDAENHILPLMESIQVYFEHDLQGTEVPSSQRAKTARILMLHGHGQSGRIFYHKTRKIIKCLQRMAAERDRKCYPGGIELFYPNGPLQASNNLEADVWVWGNGDFQRDLIKGIDEAIDKVLGILKKHGPFVGIIGFSTGAAIAAIITSLLEHQSPLRLRSNQVTHPPLEFAICFSGFKLGHSGHQQLYSALIQTPVMHFIATLDTMIPNQQTRELISQCAKRNVVSFYGTHYVPQGECQTITVCSFILRKLGWHHSYGNIE